MIGQIYLADALTKGYKTEASDPVVININPQTGKRTGIVSYGSTASAAVTPDKLTFMKSLGKVSVVGDYVATNTDIVLSADPAPAGAALAADDVVVLKLDNGTYHWTTVVSWTPGTMTMVITDALPSSLSEGNPVWCLGVATDPGHDVVQLEASTQREAKTNEMHMSNSNGEPMRIEMDNADGGGSVDYVTGFYYQFA
jgi:hypothetical protein